MRGIDIGLFEFDRHNALFFFIMNANEEIYMRYGGRDAESADTYLNLRSLEAALRKGIELHAARKNGEGQPPEERSESLFPRDIPELSRRTSGGNGCVECHLISDYQNMHREQQGTLSKLQHMYESPDIKRIGIELDIPKGLIVGSVGGAASDAGIKAGDQILKWNDHTVWTFADVQYRYGKLDREAQSVAVTVLRDDQPIDLEIKLPSLWWWSDLAYRHWTIDPLIYFKSEPLSDEEKAKLKLDPKGFASRVKYVDLLAQFQGNHTLELGDVVYRVGEAEKDPVASTADLFIKLRKTAGESMPIGVIRGGEKLEMELKTDRQEFRK